MFRHKTDELRMAIGTFAWKYEIPRAHRTSFAGRFSFLNVQTSCPLVVVCLHSYIFPTVPRDFDLLHVYALAVPYMSSSTFSAIASELVKPGLSMPNRFTQPSYPSSFRMMKSLKLFPLSTAPRSDSLGRMPA